MSRFIRNRFREFESYTPGEQPKDMEYIKLNTNESPFPPSPEVCERLTAADLEHLRLYPDPTGARLRGKIANRYAVKTENVFLSNGSDDILNFAMLAFNDDDEKLLFPEITYSFYPVIANLHGIHYETVPLREGMTIDCRDYCDRNANIILPNPNAPTGIALDISEIEEIVRTNPDRVVLIDEAYVDFGAESAVPLTHKYDNLLVSQTFSKSRSFAGGRLGFAIGNEELIRDLQTIQYSTNPYNVNSLTQILAEAAMDSGAYYRANAERIQETREFTTRELRRLGFIVLPSKANFVFTRHPEISGDAVYQKLRERGILVRHFSAPEIREYNRITIGTEAQMRKLLETLQDILREDAR